MIYVIIFFCCVGIFIFLLIRLLPVLSEHFTGRTGGGWKRLSALFPSDTIPNGKTYTRVSIQVGQILYRNCTTICISRMGLYISVDYFFPFKPKYAPVFIPWHAIVNIQWVRLFWQKAALLRLNGAPPVSITLPMRVFNELRSYIGPEILAGK